MSASELFLLPMSKHGYDTLASMCRSANGEEDGEKYVISPSPFCHETEDAKREVRGWILDMPMDAACSKLPMVDNMFHGLSIALCDLNEAEIFQLIQDGKSTKQALARAIEELMARQKKKATWSRCKPSPYAAGYPQSLMQATKSKDGSIVFEKDTGNMYEAPILDSEDWDAELSPDGFVGFYHYWDNTKGGNKLVLYCVCQSYLPKACHEFCEMLYKVGESCSASCVVLSEEAQWLRSACARNRARIIAEVCASMGIKVPHMRDYHAASSEVYNVALITTETLHHDMYVVGAESKVRVLNYCAETQKCYNGISCVMAPTEGVWIFQGIHSFHNEASLNVAGVSDFGKPFGNMVLCTSSPKVLQKHIPRHSMFTFIHGNPEDCKSHGLWPSAVSATGGRVHPGSSCYSPENLLLNLEGLDPLVAEAFQRHMHLANAEGEGHELWSERPRRDESKEYYLSFDENVLREMSRRGWPRNQGIIKLMPLVCGVYEHWKRAMVDQDS